MEQGRGQTPEFRWGHVKLYTSNRLPEVKDTWNIIWRNRREVWAGDYTKRSHLCHSQLKESQEIIEENTWVAFSCLFQIRLTSPIQNYKRLTITPSLQVLPSNY